MLDVQKFLQQYDNWKTGLDNLEEKYGIKSTIHETDGRVILNYDQIESPKNHEIVKECRGLVLDRFDGWNLVARGFKRFFNWEECKSATGLFKWDSCIAQHKEDGSFALLYYYQGNWHFNTRGSFGNGKINNLDLTWRQLFELARQNIGFQYYNLNKNYTYVFELCSRYNKVVRDYENPTLFLLSMFHNENEVNWVVAKEFGLQNNLNPVSERIFNSIDEVNNFLTENAHNDPTFEGIVLRDKNNLRFKVKSIKYVDLHKLNNNGNLASPKNLINFILDGETEEVLAYFNHLTPTVEAMESKIETAYTNLVNVWNDSKTIENQKEFAEYILTRTEFSGILFTVRKTGEELSKVWRESGDLILKKLFKE